jgi:dephospho-CoA kinase
MLRVMTVMIGLSGGIGSGKSTVARLLAERGAEVIDADAIVHELQAPGTPLVREIAEAFGPGVLDEHGALDRAALGDIVFRDADARKRLNDLVHPKVGAEFARRVQAARAAGVQLLVLDIPLLFEGRRAGTGASASMPFDATVLVYASEETQIARQMARDGCSRDEAVRRIRAQMPLAEKRALADYVIENDGPLEETERQVEALWGWLVGGPADPGDLPG